MSRSTIRKLKKRSRTAGLLATLVVVFIIVITSVLIYGSKFAPFRATVLEVDDTSIKMNYLLKRMALVQDEPFNMLQILVNEEIVKQTAPKPPYNISITEQDIDRSLRESVEDQSSFDEWFRQELKRTGFSSAEYRDLVYTSLLVRHLVQYLEERIPTVAEQVHLYMITLDSVGAARNAKLRLDAGEDFLSLAGELTVDEELRARGGDLGWYSRNGLVANLARMAFDELEVGQPSSPFSLNEELLALILVTERSAARELDEEFVLRLKARALDDWLLVELQHHRIEIYGLKNDFDAETEAWIGWQLQKMRKEL